SALPTATMIQTARRLDSIVAQRSCPWEFFSRLLEHLLEDGARSGVPRRAAGNRSPREAPGPRPPGTRTRMRGARCDRSGRKSGEGSAAPGPKIATVERRESLAEGRKAGAHKRLACPNTPNGCF